MNVPIKYGSVLALGVIGWVSISHFVLHVDQNSSLASLTLVLFNVLPIICIWLGIRERRRASARLFAIGEGVITGVSIVIVYIVIASIYFLVMGNRLLAQPPAGTEPMPLWKHFVGFVIFALLGGLFYSAIISVIVKWRQRSVSPDVDF